MMSTTRQTGIIIAPIAAAILTAFSPLGSTLPRFTLEDQYERKWQHSDFQSPLVIYVISDRTGYAYSSNWTTPLVEQYKSRVRFVPVADVRGVPGFLKGYIRSQFKKEFSYPVLLDWEGTVTTGIKFTAGVPNLAIVDASRSVRHLTAGAGTRHEINTFRDRLNQLLNETSR
jgi:hypothetical protein